MKFQPSLAREDGRLRPEDELAPPNVKIVLLSVLRDIVNGFSFFSDGYVPPLNLRERVVRRSIHSKNIAVSRAQIGHPSKIVMRVMGNCHVHFVI
jgi:hypothetical protein